ncbi:MAG: hypothetical protein WC797_03105 [Candidatus Paceibacterota bacterium]|jgi:hypothetical protein
MENSSRTIIVVLVIVFLIVGGILAYVYLNKDSFGSTTSLSTQDLSVAPQSGKALEFLRLLQSIKGLSLDTSIFNNPVFKGLVDPGVKLTDEPSGRENPFAPIGGSVSQPALSNIK